MVGGKKAFGDLAVGLTFGDQAEHFLLRRVQLRERIPAVIFIYINHFMGYACRIIFAFFNISNVKFLHAIFRMQKIPSNQFI